MYVRHLSVADFRSWPAADVEFAPGANVLVGANGQGKTNLVEAIDYLATLGSHRVAGDTPLVRAGTDAAIVRAAVVSAGRELRVEVEINAARANRARINGAPTRRPREVLGVLNCVLFAPEDLAIVRGDPSERRRFVDRLATALAPRVAGVRADYERVLKQRTALLKSAGAARRAGRSVELATLDVWDTHLAEHGAQLLAARLRAVRDLAPHAGAAYAEVAPVSSAFTLGYLGSVPMLRDASLDELAELSVETLQQALLDELAEARPKELERGVNLVGPHRDDLLLSLGELPLRGYASHGESWSSALALRLGSFELLRSGGGDPVLILDDVFAELDAGRRQQLAMLAGKAEQVIVTAAVAADVPDPLHGSWFTVADGEVRHG